MLSFDEIFKSRGYNVPTYELDADGKQRKIETREDEEQRIAYDDILNSLIAAGYYRAIIRRINPFDVIVGGMTWCIDSSDIDIDVDLLFKDSLTIGQKISLTEKIVVVLPKIKCHYFIEPHQIQGLDFIHVLPVIKWLIRWSDENRKKKKDYLLSYALNQYYKSFTHPQAERMKNLKHKTLKNISHISQNYRIRRVCKQSDKSISDLLSRVEGTLSEYGLSTYNKGMKFVVGAKGTKQLNKSQVEVLRKGLSQAEYNEAKLNFENCEQLYEDLNRSGNKLKLLKKELHNLIKEKTRLENSIEEASSESSTLQAQIEDETVKIRNLSEENKKALEEVQKVLKERLDLRKKEKKLKESCQLESENLQTEIEELETLKNQIDNLRAKLDLKKQELGKKTREVSAKERIVDQIPSRAELSQYQKRFLELYTQVALKHTETKRYFILFNTVNDKFSYMEKEFKLLNSIQDSYTQVLNAGGSKDEFLQQLEGIVSGIQDTKEKVFLKRNENKKIKDKLNENLIFLQDQKREYISAVKQLSEEYKKHEKLTSRLHRLQRHEVERKEYEK